MTTARDIITLAFKEAGILGVGQTLLAEDTNDGYTYLRRMMARWQTQRWLVPAEITVDALGNDAVSNTIGVGGHWDIAQRPDQILKGYIIQENTGSNPVSLQIKQIYSRENYDLIALKTLNTLPQAFFYDGAWPLGNVFVWPIPSSVYRVYLTIKAFLAFPNSTDELDSEFTLPENYEEAIHYNLAIRLCSGYGRVPLPTTIALAKVALATVKTANAQISELQMPSALQKGKSFNLWNADGY